MLLGLWRQEIDDGIQELRETLLRMIEELQVRRVEQRCSALRLTTRHLVLDVTPRAEVMRQQDSLEGPLRICVLLSQREKPRP